MREETRRAVANAVLPREAGDHRALFSQEANAWINMGWTDGGFFDHGAQAHVARTDVGLYHHGLAAHILLETEGTQFKGFDHASGRRFNGTVQGRTVILYDTATGRHYLYKL